MTLHICTYIPSYLGSYVMIEIADTFFAMDLHCQTAFSQNIFFFSISSFPPCFSCVVYCRKKEGSLRPFAGCGSLKEKNRCTSPLSKKTFLSKLVVEAYCVVCPIMVMGSNPARFEGGLKLKCICLHTDCFVFEGKQIR